MLWTILSPIIGFLGGAAGTAGIVLIVLSCTAALKKQASTRGLSQAARK